MGPSDPRFAALHPVSGLGLGYNDYKAIEARELVAVVGEPAFPNFAFGYRIQSVVEACVLSNAERRWVGVGEHASDQPGGPRPDYSTILTETGGW